MVEDGGENRALIGPGPSLAATHQTPQHHTELLKQIRYGRSYVDTLNLRRASLGAPPK